MGRLGSVLHTSFYTKWVGWALLTASALGVSILYVYGDKSFEVKNTSSHEKKIAMRILGYDEYVRWAERKIDRLNETIAMAENTRGKVEAYALLLYQRMAERDSQWVGTDWTLLDDEQKSVVRALIEKMNTMNQNAFIALRDASKRVLDADGYGDSFLRSYYKEHLTELQLVSPIIQKVD